jgi:hypothetical protein
VEQTHELYKLAALEEKEEPAREPFALGNRRAGVERVRDGEEGSRVRFRATGIRVDADSGLARD